MLSGRNGMAPDDRGTAPPETHRVADVTDSANLVIVANRLPVDRVETPTASTEWRRSPGGLVTALEPVMRANDGVWIGWPGGTETDLEPFEDDGLSLVPVSLSARGDRGVLRGLLQRHAVAALPRPRRQAGVPPRVVGRLRHGQPAVRRQGRRGRGQGRHGLGARLPAAAGAADAARAAARPPDRLLPAHPVPARPSCSSSCRGAGRSSRGCSAPTWSGFQLPGGAANFVRLVRQRVGHKTHRDLVYLPDGRTVRAAAFPISIDARRLRGARPAPSRSTSAAKEIREALGNPRGSSSASTGSTTPRASTPGCARSPS